MSIGTIFVLIGAIITSDQLIKHWVVNNIMGNGSMVLIPGLLQLTYVENYGAAFGILKNMRGFLLCVTFVILLGALYLLIWKKLHGFLVNFSVSLIIAGGVGNFIDRLRIGYVIDYLDITEFFSYPVFNLADCAVVIGAMLLMGYVLFTKGDVINE